MCTKLEKHPADGENKRGNEDEVCVCVTVCVYNNNQCAIST